MQKNVSITTVIRRLSTEEAETDPGFSRGIETFAASRQLLRTTGKLNTDSSLQKQSYFITIRLPCKAYCEQKILKNNFCRQHRGFVLGAKTFIPELDSF